MLITNSTTGISHYMGGNVENYSISWVIPCLV